MVGVALAGVFLAIAAYSVTFFCMKARWRVPLVYNGIGATLMSAGAFMFWMFLTNGVVSWYNFTMPEVPITAPALYIAFSVLWYVAVIKFFLSLSGAQKLKRKIIGTRIWTLFK